MDLNKATWRKAIRSTDNGGDCVEAAATSDTVAIRDSKDPDGLKLIISRRDANMLSEHIKNA